MEDMKIRGRAIAHSMWDELEKIALNVAQAPASVARRLSRGVPAGPSSPNMNSADLTQMARQAVSQEHAAQAALPESYVNWSNFFRPGTPMVQRPGAAAGKASRGREKQVTKDVEQELLRRQQELSQRIQMGDDVAGATARLAELNKLMPTVGQPAAAPGMNPMTQMALTGGGVALGGAGLLYAGNKYVQGRRTPPSGY